MTWKTRKMARRHIQNQKARINRNFKGYMLLGGIAISLAMVAIMINSNRSPLHTSLTNVQKGRRLDHNSGVVCSDETKEGYDGE